MGESKAQLRTFAASDGYPLYVTVWPVIGRPAKGQLVIIHGVQSHGGWYHHLGRTLASAGYATSFPDRRGSGANQRDRGHTPTPRRLNLDVAEWLKTVKAEQPVLPLALAGISWGGKLVVIAAARYPNLVSAVALICPGLHPRVGVSRLEQLKIFWGLMTNRRKTFEIPLSDPALFTASAEGQAFIAADPLTLREATAGLMAASSIIDLLVKWFRKKVKQPALLMLAGQDRIVDNAKTLEYFGGLASPDRKVIEYPEGHHTLEFEPDPSRYALDLVAWLDRTIGKRSGEEEMSHGTHQA